MFQSNVMYGWQLSSYRTLGRALVTIISLQIGIFNYDEVLIPPPPILSIIFICSCCDAHAEVLTFPRL